MQLSEEFNVAVVITNHVVSDPSGGAVFVADPKKPVGGHVLAHACTIRLSLRKGKGEQRLMKVVDAPNLRECPLCIRPICDQGLCLSLPGHVQTTAGQADWTADCHIRIYHCQASHCISSARPPGQRHFYYSWHCPALQLMSDACAHAMHLQAAGRRVQS